MGPKQSSESSIDRDTGYLLYGLNGSESEILVFSPAKRAFMKLKTPQGMSLKKHMAILALMPELTYMNGGILDQKVSTEHYSYNPMRNALVRMSQMIVARFNHCLTFKDGYLYAIGGNTLENGNATVQLRSCERYNQKSNKWSPITDMSLARSKAHAIIYDGSIYVFGGLKTNQKLTKKIEVYDDITNVWVILKLRLLYGIEGGLLKPLSATEFLILGGVSKQGLQLGGQQLDLSNQKAMATSEKLAVLRSGAIPILHEGKMIVIAGDENQTIECNGEMLPITLPKRDYSLYQTGSSLFLLPFLGQSQLPIATIQDYISYQLNDKITRNWVIFGETCVATVDLASGNGQTINLPQQLFLFMCGVKLFDNNYLVLGGVNKSMNLISNQTSHVQIDGKSVVITPWNYMIQARYAFTCIVIRNQLIVCGGRHYGGDDQAVLPCAENVRLDLSKGKEAKWQAIASMNERRCSHMCFEFKGKLYVVGGYKGHQIRDDSIETYDLDKDEWVMLGISLHSSMEASLLINLSNEESDKVELLLFGGRRQSGDTNQIELVSFDLNKDLDTQAIQVECYGKLEQPMCMVKGVKTSLDTVILVGKNLRLMTTTFSLKNRTGVEAKGDRKIRNLLSSGEFASQPIGKFLFI